MSAVTLCFPFDRSPGDKAADAECNEDAMWKDLIPSKPGALLSTAP